MIDSISSVTSGSATAQTQAKNHQWNIDTFINMFLLKLNNDLSTIDTDGDGTISKDELKAYLTQLFQKNSKSGQPQNIDQLVDKIFSKLDANNDGKIDKNELTSAIQKMASDLFAKIDTNGDGKIDKSELSAAMKKAHRHHGHKGGQSPNIDQLFSQLDANGDGSIDQNELTSALTSGQSNASAFSLLGLLQGPASTNS